MMWSSLLAVQGNALSQSLCVLPIHMLSTDGEGVPWVATLRSLLTSTLH